jgi:gas vesicle protein
MQTNNGFGLFVLGVGVGAAAGILLAPKTGAQTRNYLQSRAEGAARQIKEQTNHAVDQASRSFHRGTSMVRDRMNCISAAMDAGKRAYRNTVHG